MNQRQHSRLKIKTPILVSAVDTESRKYTESTETIDRSPGGMAFPLNREPGLLTQMEIYLPQEANRLVHLKSQVRHVTVCDNKKIVGVKFLGPPHLEFPKI